MATDSSASDSAGCDDAGSNSNTGRSLASRLKLRKMTAGHARPASEITTKASAPSEYFAPSVCKSGKRQRAKTARGTAKRKTCQKGVELELKKSESLCGDDKKLSNMQRSYTDTVSCTGNSGESILGETEELPSGAKPKQPSKCRRTSRKAAVGTVKGRTRKKRVESEVDISNKTDLSALSVTPVSFTLDENDNKSCNLDAEALIDEHNSSSSSDEEWEDVEDYHYSQFDTMHHPVKVEEKGSTSLVNRTIQITVEQEPEKKKKGFDLKDAFRQLLNRHKKRIQENMHKTHLLCLLAHGQYRNRLCRDSLLLGLALSITPHRFAETLPDKWTLKMLHSFLDWFRQSVVVDSELTVSSDIRVDLQSRLSESRVASLQERVLLFVLMCRAIGLCTRLAYSLQPVSFKPTDLKLKNPGKRVATAKSASVSESCAVSEEDQSQKKAASRTKQTSKRKPATASKARKAERVHEGDTEAPGHREVSLKRRCKRLVSYNESVDQSASSDDPEDESPEIAASREKNLQRVDGGDDKTVMTDTATAESVSGDHDSSDNDFQPEIVSYRTPTTSASSRKLQRRRRRQQLVTSISDSDTFVSAPDPTEADWWSEVFLESKARWIPDVLAESAAMYWLTAVSNAFDVVDDFERIASEASQPLCYVLAFDADDRVKDITGKYSSDLATSLKRLRIDDTWWDAVLQPFKPAPSCARNVAEDRLIQEKMMSQPLPSTIAEYKNHPLYALQRHLLKFEAIYPPTAIPLGFVRGEPVYARECVHLLHAREKWHTEGRFVRIGEEPYKIVRARPKWNKPKEYNDALKLNLFGYWQTEQFVPPPAVNGRVPVNEYGNVEVFKPWMLPAGTVHLRDMPGLNRVARKLNIDCPPAFVGWEFHGGFNHPVCDGWIVCEEHRDSLILAWEEEQAVLLQKEHEKKQQRVYENWRKLIKGVLILRMLKKKFDVEVSVQEPAAKKPKQKQKKPARRSRGAAASQSTEAARLSDEETETRVTEADLYWPRNRDQSADFKNADSHNLLPFERLAK